MAISYEAQKGVGGTFYVPKGTSNKPNPASEADAVSIKDYGKTIGVHAPSKLPTAKVQSAKNIKVDGKGNVVSRGGRPRMSRGTSDGTMVRHAKK